MTNMSYRVGLKICHVSIWREVALLVHAQAIELVIGTGLGPWVRLTARF